MKNTLLTVTAAALFVLPANLQAAQGTNSPYTDAVGDISTNVSSASGTLDILGMEVTNNATDITFTLSVNGNITTTDWGNFMIGISTGSTASTNTCNGWARPIQLNSPVGGMDYWVGSWVNGTNNVFNRAQLWTYSPGAGGGTGGNWSGPAPLVGYGLAPGATSTITYALSLASLGLAINDVFYFDAYSTGGGPDDSAVDALANPSVSITSWGQTYTSSTTGDGGLGLNSYQVVPEPSTVTLLVLSALGVAGYAARRRARK
jgi:hypothetical protein